MKKLAVAVMSALALGVGLTASPAEAARPCISRQEFRGLSRGLSPLQVYRRTGAKGVITYWFDGVYVKHQVREYRACNGGAYSEVEIDFDNDHRVRPNGLGLASKSVIW